jgi:hypothetical protein
LRPRREETKDDVAIYPPPGAKNGRSTTTTTTTTTWDLRGDDIANIASAATGGTDDEDGDDDIIGDELSANIDAALDLIALRAVEMLEGPSPPPPSSSSPPPPPLRPGELSMLLWAYAIVMPRDRPPGWERPRRVERPPARSSVLPPPSTSSSMAPFDRMSGGRVVGRDDEIDDDFVTFVQFGSAEDGDSGEFPSDGDLDDAVGCRGVDDDSSAGRMFDAAAIALCRPAGGGGRAGTSTSTSTSTSTTTKTTLMEGCTWGELSNVAWSYAARGACGPGGAAVSMMTNLAGEATRRMIAGRRVDGAAADDILPRDAIQIAWALGTMGSDNGDVGDALVHLVDAIRGHWIDGRESRRPLAGWTCADLAQMATAMAHGRLDNQDVLSAVYEESLGRILAGSGGDGRRGPWRNNRGADGGFSTAEISILLWVQARLYLTPKFGEMYAAFPGAASRALLRRMDAGARTNAPHRKAGGDDRSFPPASSLRRMGLGPQEQANLAWSLTVLENYDSTVVTLLQNIFHAASPFNEKFDGAAEGEDAEGDVIQIEHAHQLWQSYFLLSRDCPDAVEYVPTEFRNYLEGKWNAEKSRGKQSSSRHRAISQTLSLMKVAHRNEYEEDVDVAIVLEEDSAWTHTALHDFDFEREGGERWKKVAVEFDGPHHFTAMASTGEDLSSMEGGVKITTPRVLGHTVLKYRLLKKKGWTVVRIPYYEFDKIPFWASMVS